MTEAALKMARGLNEAPAPGVKSLAKALTLLDVVALSDHPLTISELALLAGLARPTTHRLVHTLAGAGFLQQDRLDGRLSISYAVLPLAASLLDRNRLRLEALPHLQALAHKINERVNLGILHHNRVLILAGAEKPALPTIYSRFGRTVPAHCCALGKAILANLPREEALAVIEAEPPIARTPKTLTALPELQQEFDSVRARGYSIENGENSPTSCCVGVPILDGDDRPLGAISVSARALDSLIANVGEVLRTAEVISHIL